MAGSRVKQTRAQIVGVAVDHLDDTHRGPEVVGDAGVPAVGAGPVAVPRVEHGCHRPVELLARVLQEILAAVLDEEPAESVVSR